MSVATRPFRDSTTATATTKIKDNLWVFPLFFQSSFNDFSSDAAKKSRRIRSKKGRKSNNKNKERKEHEKEFLIGQSEAPSDVVEKDVEENRCEQQMNKKSEEKSRRRINEAVSVHTKEDEWNCKEKRMNFNNKKRHHNNQSRPPQLGRRRHGNRPDLHSEDRPVQRVPNPFKLGKTR